MADFCRQCAEEHLGHTDCDDLAGLAPEGRVVSVVCEGCGHCLVDSEGNCQHSDEEHYRIWNEDLDDEEDEDDELEDDWDTEEEWPGDDIDWPRI